MIILTYKRKYEPMFPGVAAQVPSPGAFEVATFTDDNEETARAAAEQAARYGHTQVYLSRLTESFAIEPVIKSQKYPRGSE